MSLLTPHSWSLPFEPFPWAMASLCKTGMEGSVAPPEPLLLLPQCRSAPKHVTVLSPLILRALLHLWLAPCQLLRLAGFQVLYTQAPGSSGSYLIQPSPSAKVTVQVSPFPSISIHSGLCRSSPAASNMSRLSFRKLLYVQYPG